MIPKKIYLSQKMAEALNADNLGMKTIRVKTFPSKGDAVYVDVSSLWHEGKLELKDGRFLNGVLAELNDGQLTCICGRTSLPDYMAVYDRIVRYAFIEDMPTKGGAV